MDLKESITAILEKENYTFSQLADYLHMTEEGLTIELRNKTLELRNLEAISKALKVPLYSFFRSDVTGLSNNIKPYYINKIWQGDDDRKTKAELKQEIEVLKEMITLKEQLLNRLGG